MLYNVAALCGREPDQLDIKIHFVNETVYLNFVFHKL